MFFKKKERSQLVTAHDPETLQMHEVTVRKYCKYIVYAVKNSLGMEAAEDRPTIQAAGVSIMSLFNIYPNHDPPGTIRLFRASVLNNHEFSIVT